MEIVVMVGRREFEEALAAVRQASRTLTEDGLAAPLDASLYGRVAAVWDTIEAALGHAFERGLEQAKAALNDAIAQAENLLAEAGSRACDVHKMLLDRLQIYLTHLTRSALARVSVTIEIGGREFTLTKVQLANKLVLTGSLKVNLTEIFAFTTNGEITVSAEYTAGRTGSEPLTQ